MESQRTPKKESPSEVTPIKNLLMFINAGETLTLLAYFVLEFGNNP